MEAPLENGFSAAEAESVVTDAVLRAAAELKFTNEELGEIIGVSPAYVSQMRSGRKQLGHGKKPYQMAQLVVRIYRSLYPLAGGDVESMRAWIRNRNLDLGQGVPAQLMTRPQGLVGVLDYLDGQRARL